jgi:hypothetical protein
LIPSIDIGSSRYSDRLEKPGNNLLKNRHQLGGSTFMNTAVTGMAGGVLCYVGPTYLLPEAQVEYSSKAVGGLFALTFVVTAIGLTAVPGG